MRNIIFFVVAICILGYLTAIQIETSLGYGTYESGFTINYSWPVVIFFCITSFITLFTAGVAKIVKNNKVMKSFVILNLWIIVVSFVHFIYEPLSSFISYILLLIQIPLSICMYKYAVKESNTRYIRLTLLVFLLIMTYVFITNLTLVQSFQTWNSANNASYFVGYLVPLCFMVEKRYWKHICFAIALYVMLSSFKRAGLIGLISCGVIYYYIELIFVNKDRTSKLKYYFIFFVFAILIIIGVQYFLSENPFLSERFRMSESGDSNRTETWSITWKLFCESDIFSQLFGHGYDQVIKHSSLGFSSHNDYLEILYNYGLFGLISFLYLIVSLVKCCVHMIREKSEVASSFCSSVAYFLILIMMSHIVAYPYYFLYFSVSWAYMLGKYQVEKEHRITRVSQVMTHLHN